MSITNISILGCGWLGLPLAEKLISTGYIVKGSTTTEIKLKKMQNLGIKPYSIDLGSEKLTNELTDFLESDLLVINIPPGSRTRTPEFHINQIEQLLPNLIKSSTKHIIYVSSTSIYPDGNREMKETDVVEINQAENKTLATAEKMLRALTEKKVTILRSGGLTGYDRLLIRHFAGRKNLTIGEEPVNLIHRDDAIGIIQAVIKQNKWGETYNVCSPIHPLKKDFYHDLALRFNLEPPEFVPPEKISYKIVNTDKLRSDLTYSFKFSDPMKFTY